jgi:hypothetical protein
MRRAYILPIILLLTACAPAQPVPAVTLVRVLVLKAYTK